MKFEGITQMIGDKEAWRFPTLPCPWLRLCKQQRTAPVRQSSNEDFKVFSVLVGWEGRRKRRRKMR